jgi:hypothetical protein
MDSAKPSLVNSVAGESLRGGNDLSWRSRSKGTFNNIKAFLVPVLFRFRGCWNNGLLLRWDKKTRSKIIGKIRGNPAKGDGGAGGGDLNFVDSCAALDDM